MNDILFGNNNTKIIKYLSKKSYHSNKRRNIIVTITLALTAFMITSVFSLGCSYFETFQMQQTRSMGTTADVAITNLTETQIEELKHSDLVTTVGISQRLGSVDTSDKGDSLLGISWIDDTEWKQHRVPTISDVYGDYPQAENEVMLPAWALNEMGISNPQIGMNITLSYQLGNNYQYITDEFQLSGYYTDYTVSRVGNRGSVYVSQIFAEQSGLTFSDITSGMISFSSDDDVERSCEKLKDEIAFTEGQTFETVPSTQSNSVAIIVAMVFVIAVIVISGYLLIYNILYISISKDTRFYGQLKTIGATKRQIKKLVRWQVLKTSVIGIPIGLFVGALVSLIIVPFAMNMMYSGNSTLGVKVSFSPVIFIGAAIFTLLTAVIGSMKPAKIAGSISPIAALQYNAVSVKTTKKRKAHRLRLSRMALNNIFRNPKSAVLTFTSLFLGLMLFLIASGLLSSLDAKNFVSQWGESDFAVTYSIHDEDLITDEMLKEIEAIEGIENIHVTYSASPQTTMPVVYDQDVFGKYIDSLNGVSGLDFSDTETLKNYTDNFFSGIYGIDTEYVKEVNNDLETPIDLIAFENGDVVLLSAMTDEDGNSLIQPGQPITVIGETGDHTFTVADGFLDADFQSGRGNERGTAPDLYISQKALKMLSPEVKIFRIAFDTINSDDDERILSELQTITASSSGIDIQSRYERSKEIESYLFTSRVLAMGLSSVLLLIGIMNFINTMFVSVNTRKHEFATLESIGMTKKQIRQVLLFEGGYYWIISFLLLATLGTGIYLPLYVAFRQVVSYAAFSYPIIPLVIAAFIILIICLAVPIVTFRMDIKESVTKRLRQN